MPRRRMAAAIGALLLVSLLAHPGVAEAVTRSGSVSLTASSSQVAAGSAVTLRAKAPKGRFTANDRVTFQRKVGSSWKSVSTKRLTKAGRASLTVVPAVGATAYRVSKSRTKKFTAAASSPVTIAAVSAGSPVAAAPPPSSAPAVAAPSTPTTPPATPGGLRASAVSFFAPATSSQDFYVTLIVNSPAGGYSVGDPVRIESRRAAGDGWTTVATVTLAANGEGSFQTYPGLGATTYRAVKPATSEFAAAVSDTRVLRVLSRVEVSGGGYNQDVLVGETLTVTGQVKPFVSGTPVKLQEWRHDLYVTIDTSVLQADGSYRFSLIPPLGSKRYQVRVDSAGDYDVGESSPFTITVSEPVTPPPDPPTASVNGPGKLLAVTTPGGIAYTTFTAAAGQKIALGATELTGLSSGYRVNLRLFGPSGAEITASPTSSPSENVLPRGTFVSPASGTYTIVLDAEEDDVGSLKLFLSTPLIVPVSVNAPLRSVSTVGLPGREVWTTFTATAGEYLQDYSGGPTAPTPGPARLIDLATNQVVPRLNGGDYGLWLAPSTGSYRIEYEPRRATADATMVTVTGSTASAITLNGPSTKVSIDRDGQFKIYSFTSPAQQRISVAAFGLPENARYDFDVQNLDGHGTSEPAIGLNRSTFYAPQAGRYIVVVSSSQPSALTMTIDVTTPVLKSIAVNGSAVSMSMEGKIGREIFADFSATAGDYISLSTSNESNSNPMGVLLVDLSTGENQYPISALGRVWKLPTTGRYRLQFIPGSSFEKSFDVALHRSVETAIVVNGPTIGVSVLPDGPPRIFTFKLARGESVKVTTSGAAAGYQVRAYDSALQSLAYIPGAGTGTVYASQDATISLFVTGPRTATSGELKIGVTSQ